MGLKITNQKLEIYDKETVMLTFDMHQLQNIQNRGHWSYHWITLAPELSASAKYTLQRLQQVCSGLMLMEPRYHMKELTILRTFTGVCKIDRLAQAAKGLAQYFREVTPF